MPYLAGPAKPQEGRQYEVGAKYRPEGSDALLSFALFDLSQTNVPRYGNFAYRQIGQGARLLGSRYADDANSRKIDTAVVFDAMASYAISENTELALNVSNLFDED